MTTTPALPGVSFRGRPAVPRATMTVPDRRSGAASRVPGGLAWARAVALVAFLLPAVLGGDLAAAVAAAGGRPGQAGGPVSPASSPLAGRWPLEGRPDVVRRFDPPDDPYGRGHRGVDLAGAPGAAVLAAAGGVVSFAGPVAGRGVVVVTHAGGLRTTYEPVSDPAATGTAVAAGSRIGSLDAGHLGCASAACLHWGLRRGDVYLDPLSILGLGRVRLLPLRSP